jgi:hypothetical protein
VVAPHQQCPRSFVDLVVVIAQEETEETIPETDLLQEKNFGAKTSLDRR